MPALIVWKTFKKYIYIIIAVFKTVALLCLLSQTHIFSLGAVLLSVMNSDAVPYSQKLIDILNQMAQLDPSLRPQIQDIQLVSNLLAF